MITHNSSLLVVVVVVVVLSNATYASIFGTMYFFVERVIFWNKCFCD